MRAAPGLNAFVKCSEQANWHFRQPVHLSESILILNLLTWEILAANEMLRVYDMYLFFTVNGLISMIK